MKSELNILLNTLWKRTQLLLIHLFIYLQRIQKMKSQIRIKKVRIKSAAASGSYVALYGEKSNNSVKFIKSRNT